MGKDGEMDLKIFSEVVEEEALNQIHRIAEHPAFSNSKIRIMPDFHVGSGCVIGFTATLTDKIVPSIIGVDIGCGVTAVKLGNYNNLLSNEWFKELDSFIRTEIPSGFNVKEEVSADIFTGFEELGEEVKRVCSLTGQDFTRVCRSLGTLGGGNHFIELDIDQNTDLWLVIHTGSRNFGYRVAMFFQSLSTIPEGFNKSEGFLSESLKETYLDSLQVAQGYAKLNRKLILDFIVGKFLGSHLNDLLVVESVHNYIDDQKQIVRKGAISAQLGERVVIPWNMRDGIIIGVGLGNHEWNYSAPHGAGRIIGRSEAKKNLLLEDFKASMQGIWSSCIEEGTLDESPMAYKDFRDIQERIKDTVDVEFILKPVYNFKAS